jgi:hypothetical protein
MEVHSLPGVPRDGAVDHGLNTGDVISAVTNYLKSSQLAPRTADQVKANPGTTLTRDGGTTTVSEGGKVVATIDEQPGTAKQTPAKQSREPVGKSVTSTTVTTPSGATLEVAGRDVTLKRNGQSVSISEAHGVTVANSPAERAPSPKSSAPADHPAKADQKTSVPQPTGITPKIGIGANGVAERSGTTTGTKPAEHPTGGTATDSPSTKASKTATSPTDSATSGTATTSTGTGVHATNGTSTRTGSSSSLGGQQSSTPKATTSTSGSGPRSAAGSGDSKAGHSGAGSSPDSGDHKKSTDGPSHEHAAGNS